MRYLLDANAIIALLSDTTSRIARRVRRYEPRDFGVSAFVIHELYCGSFRSRRVEQNVGRVDALQFSVVEFDEEDARQTGQIRAHLASKGTPIGPYDVLIAGQARARDLDACHPQHQRISASTWIEGGGLEGFGCPTTAQGQAVTTIAVLHGRWSRDAVNRELMRWARSSTSRVCLIDTTATVRLTQPQRATRQETPRRACRESAPKCASTD